MAVTTIIQKRATVGTFTFGGREQSPGLARTRAFAFGVHQAGGTTQTTFGPRNCTSSTGVGLFITPPMTVTTITIACGCWRRRDPIRVESSNAADRLKRTDGPL